MIQHLRSQGKGPQEGSGEGFHRTDCLEVVVLEQHFEPGAGVLPVVSVVWLPREHTCAVLGVGLCELEHEFGLLGLIHKFVFVLPQESQAGEDIPDVFVLAVELGQTVQVGLVEIGAQCSQVRVEVEEVGGVLGHVALPQGTFQRFVLGQRQPLPHFLLAALEESSYSDFILSSLPPSLPLLLTSRLNIS